MSWQAVQAVMEHSRARGSERMVLMVIATHADKDTLQTFVGLETLRAETNMSERNLQYTLAKLRDSGELQIGIHKGRGNVNHYTLTLSENTQSTASITNEKRRNPTSEKTQSSVKKTQPTAPVPVEPKEPRKQPASAGSKAPPDPRSRLPAIQAILAITHRYPDRQLYDDVIATLGSHPDMAKLSACRKAWIRSGYNPNSMVWALEWYANGIPERNNGNAVGAGNRTARPDRSETNVSRWREIADDPRFGFAEDTGGSPPGVDDPFNRGDGLPVAPRAVA